MVPATPRLTYPAGRPHCQAQLRIDDTRSPQPFLGAVFFLTTTGLGIGAFVQAPAVGGICGAAAGILAAIVLVPALMRDWRD